MKMWGNLVCPAEFDTGAVKNAMILSVPEGHDKPLKYPLIFQVCDALIINKIDVLPYFDFDLEKVISYAHMRNPELKDISHFRKDRRRGRHMVRVAQSRSESMEK